VYQHVPEDRLAEIFADVVGLPVSLGAITSMVSEASGVLGLFVSAVTDLLGDAPVVHFDETDARVEGSLHWIHLASSALYPLPCCHKRRDSPALDGWKPLRSYEVLHQLCNAH
jgi:transposase